MLQALCFHGKAFSAMEALVDVLAPGDPTLRANVAGRIGVSEPLMSFSTFIIIVYTTDHFGPRVVVAPCYVSPAESAFSVYQPVVSVT